MKHFSLFLTLLISLCLQSQEFSSSPWHVEAKNIDPNNYYGITVANGMVGMVSSPDPLKVSEVILNGVYDYYQRGRVSNILKTFSHMNMHLEVDKHRISSKSISNYKQTLDMKKATLITTFDVGKKVSVKQEMMSLEKIGIKIISIDEQNIFQNITLNKEHIAETLSRIINIFKSFSTKLIKVVKKLILFYVHKRELSKCYFTHNYSIVILLC